jgi:DNA-binding transcriptional LysR family regulator
MESSGRYSGRVGIGGGSLTVELVVAPVVGRLRALHPGIRFEVIESASGDVEAAVLDGDLDFGVITMPATPPASGLLRVPLTQASMGVYVSSSHPWAGRDHVRWRDLEHQPVVTMRRGTVLWEALHRHVAHPDVVCQAMTARTLRVMVSQDAGVGVLAQLDAEHGVPGIAWVPLRDAEPVHVCLVQRQDDLPSPAALVARQLARAQAQELGQ